MSLFNTKIVVRSINVGGNNGGKIASIFFGIGTIHGINQSFGIGIAFVGRMRRSIVQHGFINGIRRLVGKNARAQKADELLNLVNTTAFHDIVIHENVFTKEFHLRNTKRGWFSCNE